MFYPLVLSLMIQIKFIIQNDGFTKKRQIQFCTNHEKNLYALYQIAKEATYRKEKNYLNHIMIICCFHIVKEVRKHANEESIQARLSKEISECHCSAQVFKEFDTISIEIIVDSIPKKIVRLSSGHRAILTKPQVLT